MLEAWPMQIVAMSGWTYCMVSNTAIPAVTDPPGLLMYSEMSRLGSSEARNSIWAMARLAIPSPIGVPMKMMRSLSRRE